MSNQEIPVEFTGRHDQITERMREHAIHKIGRLARYHARISRVQVVADHPHESPWVEMIVYVDGGKTMVAKEQAETFSNAIDALSEKIERQLKKDNEKRKDHRVDAPKGPTGGGQDEESYDDVIRKDLGGR